MTNLEREVVTRKLQSMVKYLNALSLRKSLSQEDYLNNFDEQLIVERLLHLIVEAAVDINAYLLVRSRQPPPETYYNSFIEAGTNAIISLDLANQLAPSTGLRNRLVHEYDDIDPLLVFQSIAFALKFYPQYIQQIQVYLEHSNAS
jgi:uncharacterized protein YutE (UPF0331/DUF86 family)